MCAPAFDVFVFSSRPSTTSNNQLNSNVWGTAEAVIAVKMTASKYCAAKRKAENDKTTLSDTAVRVTSKVYGDVKTHAHAHTHGESIVLRKRKRRRKKKEQKVNAFLKSG